MSEAHFGPDVRRENIDPTARIEGQSLITGSSTRIGPGVVIKDSHIHDMVIENGASIIDSVVTGTVQPSCPRPVDTSFAAKWPIGGPDRPTIGAESRIESSTLKDTSVGARSKCARTSIGASIIGPDNLIEDAFVRWTRSMALVNVHGPTEVCAAWLGHHCRIDAFGYFDGSFSNDFYVFEFDDKTGALHVRDTLDIPHVGKYGMNTIGSRNSGNILPQPDGTLRSLGPHSGIWHDHLLVHEPIMYGPCCWVASWTKVVGYSARIARSAEELVEDTQLTYLMPLSVSGLGGSSVTGQVMPGESCAGPVYKERFPAWVFTYASQAVIAAVQRIAEACGDYAVADQIAILALKNALALTRFHARKRGIDLPSASAADKGWKGWIARSRDLIEKHIASGLWEFRDGEPTQWRLFKGTWRPVKDDRLRAIAEDALEKQHTEEQLVACPTGDLPRRLGVDADDLSPTLNETHISERATVSPTAFVGPGVAVLGSSVIEDNAWLYRTVVSDSTVRSEAHLSRCAVKNSEIGSSVDMVSTSIKDSRIAEGTTAAAATINGTTLTGAARITPYAQVSSTRADHPCVIGSTIDESEANSSFMACHMLGQARGLRILPSVVQRDGGSVEIQAVPMIGGGVRILGKLGAPVTMECSFIGSNTVLEANATIGFGCFVLGRLSGEEGLPPFTVSYGAGPKRDQIGMVVHQFANIVISHFVSWAYQALGPDAAPDVALLVQSKLREGRDAVRWAMDQRGSGKLWDENAPYARYKSLGLYSETQLKTGLRAYEVALSDDRWKLEYTDGELRFTGNGAWHISEGSAQWKAHG